MPISNRDLKLTSTDVSDKRKQDHKVHKVRKDANQTIFQTVKAQIATREAKTIRMTLITNTPDNKTTTIDTISSDTIDSIVSLQFGSFITIIALVLMLHKIN